MTRTPYLIDGLAGRSTGMVFEPCNGSGSVPVRLGIRLRVLSRRGEPHRQRPAPLRFRFPAIPGEEPVASRQSGRLGRDEMRREAEACHDLRGLGPALQKRFGSLFVDAGRGAGDPAGNQVGQWGRGVIGGLGHASEMRGLGGDGAGAAEFRFGEVKGCAFEWVCVVGSGSAAGSSRMTRYQSAISDCPGAAVRPWRRAFCAARALPAALTGPRLCRAFSRLARRRRSLVMAFLQSLGHP